MQKGCPSLFPLNHISIGCHNPVAILGRPYGAVTSNALAFENMRVCMVTSWYSECGIASYTRNLAEPLNKYCTLTVLSDKAKESSTQNIRDPSKPIQSWHYKHLNLGEGFSLLRQGIRQDIVHWQFEYLLFGLLGLMYFLPILVILRLLGRRQIVTLHSIVSRKDITQELVDLSNYRIPLSLVRGSFFVYNFLMGRCAKIITHNQYGSKILSNEYYVPTSQIHIIPHGISSEHNSAENEGYLLFQGFIKPVKGLHLLINALPEIQRTIPEAKLVIAGKVMDEEYFHLALKSLEGNGTDHVEIRNSFLEDREVEGLFAKSNVVVAPYKGSVFGSSGVISRAMAHQKPVVYSPVPIFVEELRDLSTNGFAICVDPADSKRLAESVTALWKKDIDRAKYERLTALRSWNETADKTWKIYTSTS